MEFCKYTLAVNDVTSNFLTLNYLHISVINRFKTFSVRSSSVDQTPAHSSISQTVCDPYPNTTRPASFSPPSAIAAPSSYRSRSPPGAWNTAPNRVRCKCTPFYCKRSSLYFDRFPPLIWRFWQRSRRTRLCCSTIVSGSQSNGCSSEKPVGRNRPRRIRVYAMRSWFALASFSFI